MLADQIKQTSGWKENFVDTTSIVQAESWLRENLNNALENFLNNFGHRCLKEFEFISEPWGQKLEPVVVTLRAMLGQDGGIKNEDQVQVYIIIMLIKVVINE